MYHFFAKLGRKGFSRAIVPAFAFFSSTGYLGYHFYGHNLTRDLLAAENEPGKRAEISGDLQKLILSVYEDVQVDFNKPILNLPGWKVPTPTIKWFASASIEPLTIGMTESNFGVLIGLPNHYNYEKLEDLPRSLLDVRKFNIFKSFSSKNPQKEKDSPLENSPDCENCDVGEVTKINPKTEEGIAYLDSLVLSEKAKRFSIARELFIGDSYQPLNTTSIIIFSFLLAISLSRLSVSKFGYKNAHLTQRIPFYGLSGVIGLYTFFTFKDMNNRFYTKEADTRAMRLGETYREGAVEYFTKTIQRHKALRNLFDDFKNIYDENGNVVEPIVRMRFVPVTERLEMAQKMKIKTAEC